MTDQIFAREISSGLWQWAGCDEHGVWRENSFNSGDSEALASQMASDYSSATPVSIVLRGQHIVATSVSIDTAQRKHAAKLIPYELEDELSSSVDDLHFAFTHQAHDDTAVLYADQSQCESAINDLAGQGCDVSTALPDYLMLVRDENQLVLLLEGGILTARISEHWGFSVEQELAHLILDRLAKHSALSDSPPAQIKCVAGSDGETEQLMAMLPSEWQSIEHTQVLGGFWDCFDTSVAAKSLNLRRGALSRQLPFAKWWVFWKLPLIVLALAFVCALTVNFVAYLGAKSKETQVRENINAVYLDAIPNGRLGDVERILESKLSGVGKPSSEPSNFGYLLSNVIEALPNEVDAAGSITVTSFTYNGDQRALQLTIEFQALSALADLRTTLSELGIQSDSPRTSSLGDGYQARLKIQEQP